MWSRKDGSEARQGEQSAPRDDVDRRLKRLPDRAARRPDHIRRIEDSQDKLAKVEALRAKLKKEEDPIQLAKQRDELQANVKAQVAQRCAHLQGLPDRPAEIRGLPDPETACRIRRVRSTPVHWIAHVEHG